MVLHDSVSEEADVSLTETVFLCSASRDSSLISFLMDSLRSLPTRSAYGESVTGTKSKCQSLYKNSPRTNLLNKLAQYTKFPVHYTKAFMLHLSLFSLLSTTYVHYIHRYSDGNFCRYLPTYIIYFLTNYALYSIYTNYIHIRRLEFHFFVFGSPFDCAIRFDSFLFLRCRNREIYRVLRQRATVTTILRKLSQG